MNATTKQCAGTNKFPESSFCPCASCMRSTDASDGPPPPSAGPTHGAPIPLGLLFVGDRGAPGEALPQRLVGPLTYSSVDTNTIEEEESLLGLEKPETEDRQSGLLSRGIRLPRRNGDRRKRWGSRAVQQSEAVFRATSILV